MNAEDFHALYEYHFALNRKVWSYCIAPLTEEQFRQPSGYSVGSVHNQVAHMINADNAWFGDLLGETEADDLDLAAQYSREELRLKWDAAEQKMRGYLAALTDEMLAAFPLEADPFPLWQVLLHVVNHGTDHRAQLLAQVNRVGGRTMPQDYIFYLHKDL